MQQTQPIMHITLGIHAGPGRLLPVGPGGAALRCPSFGGFP